RRVLFTIIFFCYAPPPPDTYTLSLHDALPILRLPEDRGREELPQCLESVERARRAVGSNRDARRAGVEPIAFVAEAGEGGVEADGDDWRPRGRGAAHGEPQTGGWVEIVAQQLAHPSQGAIGQEHRAGRRCESARPHGDVDR